MWNQTFGSILCLKKNLVNWTDSEHLYTVNFDNIYYLEGGHTFIKMNKK